ncbi:MAG: large repetitive protein, partial [Thermoleophilaceae bacterium]|nr:large repetitive protein [Thermoleophilaceae bacterium]
MLGWAHARLVPAIVVLAMVLMCGFGVASAQAVKFTVNTGVDGVDVIPGNGTCDTGTGACTLRAAIQEANALPGADEIDLGARTHNLTIAGASENSSATGDLDIASDITIVGDCARTSIIDATGLGDRILEVLSGTVDLQNVRLTNGNTSNSGAGIDNHSTSLTLTNSQVDHNTGAGGIQNEDGATTHLVRSMVSDNSTTSSGGGITNYGTLTLDNSSVVHNSASFFGGGIRQPTSGGPPPPGRMVTLRFSTVALNTTPSSNGVGVSVAQGPFVAASSIIARNLGGATESNCAIPADSASHSLEGGTDCGFTGGGNVQNGDPQFAGALADNGGCTDTLAIQSASQAINLGDPAGAPTVDQRGFPRPVGGGPDSGSFEFGSSGNQAPVANDDTGSTSEDTQLNVSAPGVLTNDTDQNGDTLTATMVTGPSHGNLTFNSNGSYSYTPAANYNGPDSFTYKANDGAADSNIATVNITVTAVNDA